MRTDHTPDDRRTESDPRIPEYDDPVDVALEVALDLADDDEVIEYIRRAQQSRVRALDDAERRAEDREAEDRGDVPPWQDPDRPVTKPYSKEEIVAGLQYLHRELNRTPKCQDLRERDDIFSEGPVKRHFGRFADALRAAHIPVEYEQGMSNEELSEYLSDLAYILERVPSSNDMDEHGRYSASLYESRFGSWNDALRAADFEPNRKRNVSDEELLEDLRRVDRLTDGRTLYWEYDRRGEFSAETLSRRFGCWPLACKEAGVRYSWTKFLTELRYSDKWEKFRKAHFSDEERDEFLGYWPTDAHERGQAIADGGVGHVE